MGTRDLVAAGVFAGGMLWLAQVTSHTRSQATEGKESRPRTRPSRRLPRPGPMATAVSDRRPRGSRITKSRIRATGDVRESAPVLLREARKVDAALTLDEYVAARLAVSEHASGSMAELTAIIDAEVNRAEELGRTLFDSLTRGNGFGRQGRKRPASTARDPREVHLQAALAVLRTGTARGAAHGARRFFDPRAQRHLWKQGRACHPLVVLERWSFDLPWLRRGGKRRDPRDKHGRRMCPLNRGRSGSSTEAWVGELPSIDSSRLMLFKGLALGGEHSSAYEAAKATITKNVTGAFVA